MGALENLFGGKSSAPSIIKNPFEGEHITRVTMVGRKRLFDLDGWQFYATIEFKNGGTSGEQEIEASNMAELYEKVADFCANI